MKGVANGLSFCAIFSERQGRGTLLQSQQSLNTIQFTTVESPHDEVQELAARGRVGIRMPAQLRL